ncbi:ATP-dependent DNA helicase pif1 [Elysia marginata]|uniref:ATP-dependent DNA helicase pif1 n=1 Tax=Elysia marginata TaxID=1093978 RepID=A0AAV4IMU9_9GAST|nr:ATP-dependent DNA helicase pif1 [Elysia marginata]
MAMSSTRPTLRARSRRRARATVLDRESFSHDLGRMNVRCEHCGAFRWKAENKALCCENGQMTLPPLPRTPSLLMKLLSGTDLKAKRFREKFRAYNNALAFASLGVNEEILPPTWSILLQDSRRGAPFNWAIDKCTKQINKM